MKKVIIFFLATLSICVAQTVEKTTLAVSKIGATTALVNDMKAKGTLPTMERVVQAIDSNLSSAFQATRKFSVLTRADVDIVLKEQDFVASGNVSVVSKVAQIGKLKGAKYIVSVMVDDFQDYVEKDTFATIKKKLETRKIRIGAVANIIDTSTGEIKETANFVITNDGISDKDLATQILGGSSTDSLIPILARNICSQIAIKVVDMVFPPVIIAKNGKTITFNRNLAMGVAVGDEYGIFAQGEEMVDPDTGDKLGYEEISAGKLKVISVNDKFSVGVLTEDNGVLKGQNLRLIKKAPQAPAQNTSANEI